MTNKQKSRGEIYIINPNIGICETCGREDELRYDNCFDCAEAQSILIEGKDMYDNGNAKTALEKMKMLIEKGWTPPSQLKNHDR